MPFPPFRESTLYWWGTFAGAVDTTKVGDILTTFGDTAQGLTRVVLTQGTASFTLRPQANAGLANVPDFQGFGWAVRLSHMAPTDTRGRAVLRAGAIAVSCSVTQANSAATVGSGSITPRLSLWKYNTTTKAATLIASNTGAAVAFPTLSLTQTVSVSVTVASDVLFERNEVLYFQTGGNYTAPAGTVTSNTATWTYSLGVAASQVNLTGGAMLRVHFVPESYLAVARAIARSAGSRVRKALTRVARGTGTVTRSLVLARPMVAAARVQAVNRSRRIAKSLTVAARGRAIGPSRILKVAYACVGVAVGARRATVRKQMEASGRGAGTMDRLVTFVREFAVTGAGTGSEVAKRVIFVRHFLAKARPKLRTRLGLDWDDLPAGEGGGSIVKKVALFLFDD